MVGQFVSANKNKISDFNEQSYFVYEKVSLIKMQGHIDHHQHVTC